MSWLLEQQQIAARFESLAPVPEERRDWSAFNLPHGDYGLPFKKPSVDPSDPESSIWQRLSLRPIPGSARPFHLGLEALRYREGMIFLQTFGAKLTAGEAILQAAQEAGEIYHREQFGIINCRDMDTPEWVDTKQSPWRQVNCHIMYYVFDPEGS